MEPFDPPRKRLLILACSGTKRGRPKRIPACDRCDTPVWRTLRAVDPDGCKAKVAFLSACYAATAARLSRQPDRVR